MDLRNLEKLKNEGVEHLPSEERRRFLKLGFLITGVFAGGKILSVMSDGELFAASPEFKEYPYKPHYSMLMRVDRCIDCELCKEACVKTNNVPKYGWRTTILERQLKVSPTETYVEFMPVLCNQCNKPPCVRVCPTTATYKNKKNGIVMMDNKKCIGCKTCMTACPYNARYFKEEARAVDKCDFCYNTRLSKGINNTACSEACPADVRIFGDISDPSSRVYKMVRDPSRAVWVLRPETGAAPNVFYTKG